MQRKDLQRKTGAHSSAHRSECSASAGGLARRRHRDGERRPGAIGYGLQDSKPSAKARSLFTVTLKFWLLTAPNEPPVACTCSPLATV